MTLNPLFTTRQRDCAGTVPPGPLDWVDLLAIAYLALPVLIFFLGWFAPAFGVPLALLLLAGLGPLFTQARARPRFGPSAGIALTAAAVALVWTSLGGAGHFFHANFDWITRDAVLRDLAIASWPPAYGTVDGIDLILRCPVAYYLPAALLAKAFGPDSADFFLFAWTALGTGLFLMIALAPARTPRQVATTVLVIVFFSGMDIVGDNLFRKLPATLTDHLEWWTGLFQYSANTTLLFWVPNHALPAWLVAALACKNFRNPAFLRLLPIALAVTPLWSPLATIGLAPFALALAWHHLREGSWRTGVAPWSWLGCITTLAATGAYLTMDSTRIPSGWTISKVGSVVQLAWVYGLFVFLEFGFLALMVWRIRRDMLIATASLVLLALPMYTFGPGNDLAMRASIPALTVLCLAAGEALAAVRWNERPALVVPLLFCLTIGSVTAIHEIARSLLHQRWQPRPDLNLIEVAKSVPPHYVARLNAPVLAATMHSPGIVPGMHLQLRTNP